jgi:aquaporin Z
MATAPSNIKLYLSEFVGTALLLTVGLSFVIFNWGDGTIMDRWIPDQGLRRAITGFLFGTTGCLITLSPVGKISGAHINPAVSFGFWLCGKMTNSAFAGFVIAQLLGAVVGSIPLLLWGQQGNSINYGNTVPGQDGIVPAFIGEMLTTACLIILLYFFVGNKRLRAYTPYTIPLLYSFMVWAESPLSGCSTNPARSLGPAVISGVYNGSWLYLIAPICGVLLVLGLVKLFSIKWHWHIGAARLSYHDHPTPEAIKTSS